VEKPRSRGYFLVLPPTTIPQRTNVRAGKAVSPGREEALTL